MCLDRRNTTLDVEPIYTLRGHRTPVLSMAINQAGSQLFSGSLDGTIRTWNLPSLAIDPYDPFGVLSLRASFAYHVYSTSMYNGAQVCWRTFDFRQKNSSTLLSYDDYSGLYQL